MCGRYRLTKRRMLEIEDYYEIDQVADLELWKREYNIPPREMAPVVLESDGKRSLTAGLWSLMGPWADSLEHANRASTFKAKAETLSERPAYCNAFLKRHCVVPAEAFCEGKATAEHCEEGWKALVDGGAVQLLESSRLAKLPYADVYRGYDCTQSVYGENSQQNARDLAG